MDILALVLAAGGLGQTAAIVYLAIKLASAKDAEASARELAAQRVAEATVDAGKVSDANAATVAATTAEQRQAQRGDALEKELADEAHPAGSGLDRLRVEAAAVSGPGPVADPSGPRKP